MALIKITELRHDTVKNKWVATWTNGTDSIKIDLSEQDGDRLVALNHWERKFTDDETIWYFGTDRSITIS